MTQKSKDTNTKWEGNKTKIYLPYTVYQSELKGRVDYDTYIHWLQFSLVVWVKCDNQKIAVKRKWHKNKAWKTKKLITGSHNVSCC